MREMQLPLDKDIAASLSTGDDVLISGKVLVARDQAHLRLVELIKNGRPLPVQLKNAIIFYAGPTPGKNGAPIGTIGPTTSSRMDPFASVLLEAGVIGMIGKGRRSSEIKEAIKKHGAVYFAALGGVAALYSKMVVSSKLVAFEDLGPEAIYEVELKRMPCIVEIDTSGKSLYERTMKTER